MAATVRPGRLTAFERAVLSTLDGAGLTALEVAGLLRTNDVAVKGSLGRMRQRDLVRDDGGRPPRYFASPGAVALLGMLAEAEAA